VHLRLDQAHLVHLGFGLVHGKFSCIPALLTLSRARTHEERTVAHFLPDVRDLYNVQLVVNTNTPYISCKVLFIWLVLLLIFQHIIGKSN
jgi:hypothetical protein